jgi:transmembrane sensor
MNDRILHIEDSGKLSIGFFEMGKLSWEKPKEQIWEEMFSGLQEAERPKVVSISRVIFLRIAASIALLIAIGSGLWFWQKNVACPAGQHLTALLPDGSTIEMNAESSLKYFPLRWYISRNAVFKGEGFFSIEKGKKFEIRSEFGKTSVLGTSFNIYARDDLYSVSCLTGKVLVSSPEHESVILNPNQQVILRKGYELKKTEIAKPGNIVSWRNNWFLFSASPFTNVIKEIERQYGIVILTDGNTNGIFTGNFSRKSDVEEVLGLVCSPFGYKFVRKTEKNYIILP